MNADHEARAGRQSVIIRRATPADVTSLLPLVEAYWRFEAVEGFDPQPVAAQLQRLLADDRLGAAWLALVDGVTAGYLLAVQVFSLEHRGLTAEVDELFVGSGHRAAGLGRRLLQAAESEFAARGCTNVSLQLGRGNDAGRAFYLSQGYAPRAGFELLEKPLRPPRC
jgi:GNAT superfamily N-acetyltransferase